jgi:hypothetical protein
MITQNFWGMRARIRVFEGHILPRGLMLYRHMPQISEFADKKSANFEGHLYFKAYSSLILSTVKLGYNEQLGTGRICSL